MVLKIDGKSGDSNLEVNYGVVSSDLRLKFLEEVTAAFDSLSEDKFELWKRKQASYGSTNISALGLKGVFIRMWDKLQRLRTLVWLGHSNPLTDESTEDTFGDVFIYTTIALLLMRGQWPEYVDPQDIMEAIDASRR